MATPDRDPYLALRHPGYRRYITAHFLANVGRQALVASLMWQVYQWTHSATALGLIGLTNVLPLLALILPAGALADRCDQTGETVFCYLRDAAPLIANLATRGELRYVHRPANLEDVFLRLTGRDLRD